MDFGSVLLSSQGLKKNERARATTFFADHTVLFSRFSSSLLETCITPSSCKHDRGLLHLRARQTERPVTRRVSRVCVVATAVGSDASRVAHERA